MKIFKLLFLACFSTIFISCKQTPEAPKEKPKPERTLKVALIGDQIMLGEKLDSADRYPAQLQWLLGEDYFVQTFALKKATVLKNGNKPFIKDILFRQAIDFQPDIVIINLGINDTKMSNWWEYGTEFLDDYMEIVVTFQSLEHQPEIMVCRPTKPFDIVSGINDSTMRVGILPNIDSVAIRQRAETIDLYTILEYRRDIFKGYLYPNPTACRIIAETIADAIVSDVKPLNQNFEQQEH